MYNNQLDIIYKELAPHMRRFADLKESIRTRSNAVLRLTCTVRSRI